MTTTETSAERAKRTFDEALKSCEARVAILVRNNIDNALDLLDAQPARSIEMLIEHAKEIQQSGNALKHRYKIGAAIIEYLEERLLEAREHERQLAEALTGVDLPND